MPESIKNEAIMVGQTPATRETRLSITEIEARYLWSVQGNRALDLGAFTTAVFAATPAFGKTLGKDSLRLLQLWPHKAYLLTDNAVLPAAALPFAVLLTDIGHGFCEFSLAGDDALLFLNDYTSADLTHPGSNSWRCLLGQFQVIIWWQQITDIRILVERSYAQSFHDYLEQLMQRWSR